MSNWRDYIKLQRGGFHSVVGDLRVLHRVWSPQLRNQRDILVHLPPSYTTSDKQYPVLYMHDGQNLFDEGTSYSREWTVDETMEGLAEEGLEAIVVGIPNMGGERLAEYSPFVDAYYGSGRGDKYVAFVVDTVKSIIDRDFRTLPGREHTGIMGSSMGGLISLYAYFRQPYTFGFAGIMSPSVWFADGAAFEYVANAEFVPGKIYLDVGTREYGNTPHNNAIKRSRKYYAKVRRLKRILVQKGYRPTVDLLHVEEKWAGHNEPAWARRLPFALRFLLS